MPSSGPSASTPMASVGLPWTSISWQRPGREQRVLEFLESLGYETLHVSTGYSNHLHPLPAMGRVDLVYVGGDTGRLLFGQCARALDLGGQRLPVPRPEHLAAMKVQAMKNDPSRTLQDMADIQFLLRSPGSTRMRFAVTSSVPGCWSATVRSSGSREFLSLDEDLPTTADDVAALAGLRRRGPTDLAGYLRFLAGFPAPPAARPARPARTRRSATFELRPTERRWEEF